MSLAALTIAVAKCGYGGPSPTAPADPPNLPAGAITIDVVRENGAQSFNAPGTASKRP